MVPKYEFILNELKLELHNHQFSPGDRFYSEANIKDKYNVSATTAVKVLNILANENYITRMQGKGTFVAKENHDLKVRLTDMHFPTNGRDKTKVLQVQYASEPDVLKQLKLAENDRYLEVHRIRYTNDIPIQFSISCFPGHLMNYKNVNEKSLTSIYSFFKKEFNINFYEMQFNQETRIIELTDEKITNALNLSLNVPVIYQVRHTVDNSEQVLKYTRSFKNVDFWGEKIEKMG